MFFSPFLRFAIYFLHVKGICDNFSYRTIIIMQFQEISIKDNFLSMKVTSCTCIHICMIKANKGKRISFHSNISHSVLYQNNFLINHNLYFI